MSAPLPVILFDGSFEPEGQQRFAVLSGDSNAIHLHATRARREFYGRRILHGLHGAMRALDALLASRHQRGHGPVQLTGIRARFLAPVFLGERIQVVAVREDEGGAALQVRHGSTTLYEIELRWVPGVAAAGPEVPKAPGTGTPAELAFQELAGRRGTMPLSLDAEALVDSFPHLACAIPRRTAAAALAVTRLVGMEVPGAQSLLSSFDLRMDDGPGDELAWEVTSAVKRFSLVKLGVRGGGLAGTVDAFHRPAVEAQPALEALGALVPPDSFSGMRVLVIGGSRGLGEACAKLIAAGGGDVTITWHRLVTEAERVAGEIQRAGHRCAALQWSVLQPDRGAMALRERGWQPTHVVYCATPRQELRRGPGFSPPLLRSLMRIGVQGLEATIRAVRAGRRDALHIVVPSTALLSGPPAQLKGQAEFVASKAAAEALCAALAAQDQLLTFTVARLPRLRTDQSQSLSPRPLAEAADAMLPFLLAARDTRA